jgi:chlorite dismutase
MEYTENSIKHVMLPPVAELQRIFAPMKSGSIFVMALHSTDSYKKMHFGVFDDYKSLNNALRVLNRTDNQEQTQEYKSVNLWNHKTGPVSTNNISVNDKSPWHQVNNSSIKLRKNFAADTDDVIIYHEFTVDETKDIKNMLDMSHRPTGGSVNAYSSRSSVARSQSAFSRMLPASNKQRGQ